MQTDAQREEILKEVCLMESFFRHMSHPKLQNWFAWNRCCYEQGHEFWATKLVFEATLSRDQVAADDSRFSIKPGTDVRAELQRLLKNGGGPALAFRLMKEGLQQYIKIQYYCEKALPETVLLKGHTAVSLNNLFSNMLDMS